MSTSTNPSEQSINNQADSGALMAPSFDATSLPAEIVPGDSIRLRGEAAAGSVIRVLVDETVVSTAVAGDTGAFRATVGFSAPGTYAVIANLIGDDDEIVASSEPLLITVGEAEQAATPTPVAAPTATTAVAATSAATAPTLDSSMIPAELVPGDSIRLRGEAEPGSTVRVSINDTVVASALAGDTGAFRATVGFGQAGTYTVTASLIDENDAVIAVSEPLSITVAEAEQAATPTSAATNTATALPTATNTVAPTPTATDTAAPTETSTTAPTATEIPPTATETVEEPTLAAAAMSGPILDMTSIPAELLPGDSFRLRGEAEPGSTVRVSINDAVVASAIAGDTGAFRATVGFGQAGTYTVTASLIDEDDEITAVSEPLSITVAEAPPVVPDTPTPPPTDTPEPTAAPTATNTATAVPTPTSTPQPTATNTLEPTATSAPVAPEVDLDRIPAEILPGDSVRLFGQADAGATVRVAVNDAVVGSAIAGDAGSFRTTVGFGQPGVYTVTLQLVGEDDDILAVSEPVTLTVLEPEPTATNTSEPTATNTTAPTATNTPEPTATNTTAPTATNTPEPTATNTTAPTATNTPEPTATNTTAPTATNTPEPTATNTTAPTATNTPEPTATEVVLLAPSIDLAALPTEILPGDSIRLRGQAAPGSTVQVLVNDQPVARAIAGDTGVFRATIGFAQPGENFVTLQVVDEAGEVLIASDPLPFTVSEPVATAAAAVAPPASSATMTPTVVSRVEVTATASLTDTLGESSVMTQTAAALQQPPELPSTGIAMDQLGVYNLLLPLALIIALAGVTLFQRKRG